MFAAEQTYNSNINILIEISRTYGFVLGDWDSAIKTVARAKRLTSTKGNSVFHVDAGHLILTEANADGWRNCLKAYSEHSKMSNLLVNACAKKYSKADWEHQTNENLNKLNLKTKTQRERFLTDMRFEAGVIAEIITPRKYTLYD